MSEFDKAKASAWAEHGGIAGFATAFEDGWNAALAAAAAKMPGEAVANYGDETGATRGWNRCLSEVSERLASLKASPLSGLKPGEEGGRDV